MYAKIVQKTWYVKLQFSNKMQVPLYLKKEKINYMIIKYEKVNMRDRKKKTNIRIKSKIRVDKQTVHS